MNNNKKDKRIGEEKYNSQGYLMKIIEYNNVNDMTVEFQDKYKARINTRYSHFSNGDIKNPYHPDLYNIGINGNKFIKTMLKLSICDMVIEPRHIWAR